MTKIEQLEAELAGLNALIEAAAVQQDGEEYVRLSMRRSALPYLLREAKVAPIRDDIRRLEEVAANLETERQRIQTEPPPEVPPGRRGHITPVMVKNARLKGVIDQQSSISRELKEKRRELEQIKAEGPRP